MCVIPYGVTSNTTLIPIRTLWTRLKANSIFIFFSLQEINQRLLVPVIWKRASDELSRKLRRKHWTRRGWETCTQIIARSNGIRLEKERTATIYSLVGIEVVMRINEVTCSHRRSMAICKPTVEDVYFCVSHQKKEKRSTVFSPLFFPSFALRRKNKLSWINLNLGIFIQRCWEYSYVRSGRCLSKSKKVNSSEQAHEWAQAIF